MTEQQTRTLPLRAAYPFAEASGLGREAAEIKDMVEEWDLAKGSSLRRAYIVDLFRKHGVFDQFKATHWNFGNTPAGERKCRSYFRLKQRYEDFLAGRAPELDADLESLEEEEEAQSFAREDDLRDFLAKNPSCIERGLMVYGEGGRSGIEFAVDDGRGRVDILAMDCDQRFVVIELKVGRGRNKTIGQLLYYMGWVDKHLSKDKKCRGIIIAREITDDLVLAVQRVPDVTLCRYNLSVTIEAVTTEI